MDKIITTSWDDGHPLDFRLAELLHKYNLKATFYIPKHNPQNVVMGEHDVHLLSKTFEIGGHTLNHVNLTRLNGNALKEQIDGCYNWLTAVVGQKPVSFCPPFGAFNNTVLRAVSHAGFKTIRSTQLLSTSSQQLVAHTTLQMYKHTTLTYAKHLIKRARVNDLAFWLLSGPTCDLFKLVDFYLCDIDKNGGCFHLWGHSWEIEKFNLWVKLESLLQHLSQREGYHYVANAELAKR
ncbi:polysaccharide deacetylase family protein [Pedobacter endophyticus]|uniref:Polysaccharide deacetylase family protein n=1 Tax=Pedobacter endophyticus TaxID=2789740 RepID=A0A7S9L273_9SPHI|nr:polysaccharide deacetylase family protein [Pedobacter endophyticus]QPH40894.1 polysaccharide deacetylase family protein [Pedobacter endophyticus]